MPRVLRRGRWSGQGARRKIRVRRPARMVRRLACGRIGGPIQPVQFFKRSQYLPGYFAHSTTDTSGAFIFRLSDVPDVADFTNLYDMYKINLVKWTLIPRGNSSDVTTQGQSMGVFTALDYDDNATPASLDTIMQYQNMKMTRSTQQHKRILRPLARNNIIGAGGTVNNGPYRGWLDCGSTTTPHFGIKFWLQALPSGIQQYDIKLDYYLSFKNVR